MLQTETVERETLELLKTLMRDEKLADFILAGGTNLALCLGHRKSIDLDLFPYTSFDALELSQYLRKKYNFVPQRERERNTVQGFINDVKIDFVAHVYPLLKEPVIEEGIRMYSLYDIAAMKLGAIGNNGTRLKDFVDIACLSTQMSLSEMLSMYGKKYNINPAHALRGLSYFADIDFDVNIDLIKGRFNWRKIEKRILEMIKYEDKVFEILPV
jgi:hypothetical protein